MDMGYMIPYKVFHHPDRISSFLESIPVKPITAKIYLTDRCNLKCYYCIYKDRISNKDMNTRDVKDILDKLKSMGIKGLVFTGGEPTLHKKYKEIIKEASFNFDIGFITNGIIYPDILDYLKWIRFSLDSANGEIYKNIKGADRSAEVIANITKAIKEKRSNNLKVTIGIQAVLTRENIFDIKNSIYVADKLGADYFQFRPLENEEYNQTMWVKIWQLIEASRYLDVKIKIIPTLYKWKALWENKKNLDCKILNFIISVSSAGILFPCCFLVGKKYAECGNMLTNSVGELFNKRQKIIKDLDHSKCPILCQGTSINEVLNEFYNIGHINFI